MRCPENDARDVNANKEHAHATDGGSLTEWDAFGAGHIKKNIHKSKSMSDVVLRYYQKNAYPAIVKYLSENEGHHPLLAYPTGAGKTIILSDIIKNAIDDYDDLHVLVISHVKEILEQDYNALTRYLKRPIGLYSSGLRSNSREQVTVAGIQSIYDKFELFEKYKLIIVDECHLIPPKGDGMYQKFLKGVGEHTRIGLTATPYRLGTGYIYGPDHMFDDLIVDYTYMEKFNELIEKGYLCDLRAFSTKVEMDLSGVRTVAGDFNEKDLSDKFDREEITRAIVKEILKIKDAKKGLIFAIDIDHAEHIAEILLQSGESAYVVHSKMGESNRDNVIKMFKDGRIRYLVNVNILTTGFDAPDIDLICLLRPTKSPVLHVQSIGRGLRVHPSKAYTMVLDFAGNTERLGPINNIVVRKKREGKEQQEPITKRCPVCDMIHAPAVRICINCGHEFQFKTDLRTSSTAAAIIQSDKIRQFDVDDVFYKISEKPGRPPILKAVHQCGLRQFVDNICIEHDGYAGHRARHWAMLRLPDDILVDFLTVADLFNIKHLLRKPKSIEVSEGGKYANIIKYVF